MVSKSIERSDGGSNSLPSQSESRWNGRRIAIIGGTALGFSAGSALIGFAFFGPMGAVAGAVAGFAAGLFYGIAMSQNLNKRVESSVTTSYVEKLPEMRENEEKAEERRKQVNLANAAVDWLVSQWAVYSDFEQPTSSDDEGNGPSLIGASRKSPVWNKDKLKVYISELKDKPESTLLPEEIKFLSRVAKLNGF